MMMTLRDKILLQREKDTVSWELIQRFTFIDIAGIGVVEELSMLLYAKVASMGGSGFVYDTIFGLRGLKRPFEWAIGR